MVMFTDFRRISEEEVVVYFQVLSQHLLDTTLRDMSSKLE